MHKAYQTYSYVKDCYSFCHESHWTCLHVMIGEVWFVIHSLRIPGRVFCYLHAYCMFKDVVKCICKFRLMLTSPCFSFLDSKKKKKGSSPPSSRKSGKFTALKSNSPDPDLNQTDQNSNQSSETKASHPRKRKQLAANKENKPTASKASTSDGAPVQKKLKADSPSPENAEDSLDSSPVQKDQEQQVNFAQSPYPEHDHPYALLPGEPLKSDEEQSPDSESGTNSLSSGISIKSEDAAGESSGITLECFPMAAHEETIQATAVPEPAGKGQCLTLVFSVSLSLSLSAFLSLFCLFLCVSLSVCVCVCVCVSLSLTHSHTASPSALFSVAIIISLGGMAFFFCYLQV